MKTPTFQDQNLGTFEGFKVVLSFEEEHLNAKDHFMGECGWSKEEYSSIKNYYWFTAKVTAYKGSIECGSAYLGACCHENLKSIMNPLGCKSLGHVLGGYAPQMIEEAIEEAKAALQD